MTLPESCVAAAVILLSLTLPQISYMGLPSNASILVPWKVFLTLVNTDLVHSKDEHPQN